MFHSVKTPSQGNPKHRPEPETHLDGCDGKRYLPPPINVRVENTKNVLELFRNDQRLEISINKGVNPTVPVHLRTS